jgi:hypothetical protein
LSDGHINPYLAKVEKMDELPIMLPDGRLDWTGRLKGQTTLSVSVVLLKSGVQGYSDCHSWLYVQFRDPTSITPTFDSRF